ncbi:acyltransferase family protein [Paenibacillus sp. GCM10027627]|uniref:acyltransferase family protein n=1 Tax=unclassified Paenibacillus TaxID=185978 RepID=UPI0036313D13
MRHYESLDLVKLAAAFLVVAIHTGPLLSLSPYADFLLTGIFARLAVPFFFMASGYLLFRKLTGDARMDGLKVQRYMYKVTALYAVAIIIYLPLNLYKGDFGLDWSLPSAAADLVWNGTFYHLWYLPALMMGAGIVYFMQKYFSLAATLVATILFYVVGLLGDSYYGFAIRSDGLKALYEAMFGWFDYTRNGLFFAPVFVALGMLAARQTAQQNYEASGRPLLWTILFSLSLTGLFAEGMFVRAAEFPRHDSMYLMLLPAVYCLFRLALGLNARSFYWARPLSLWIYIFHPAAIVLVHGIADVVRMDGLFIENKLMHYVAVCLVSAGMSFIIVAARKKWFKRSPRTKVRPHTPSPARSRIRSKLLP